MSDVDIELTEIIIGSDFIYRYWLVFSDHEYTDDPAVRHAQVHGSANKGDVIALAVKGL